jgi:hypothetical protein
MTKFLNHWTICLLFQVSWLKRDISTKGVPALLTFGNTVYISDARFSIQRHTDDWVKRCFKWHFVSKDILFQMTFRFKWRFFQMTFRFKQRFWKTFCFKRLFKKTFSIDVFVSFFTFQKPKKSVTESLKSPDF